MLESRVWKLEAREGMRLCEECADFFGVFQSEHMGSKFSKTAEVC